MFHPVDFKAFWLRNEAIYLKFIDGALGASIVSLLPEFDTGDFPSSENWGLQSCPAKTGSKIGSIINSPCPIVLNFDPDVAELRKSTSGQIQDGIRLRILNHHHHYSTFLKWPKQLKLLQRPL